MCSSRVRGFHRGQGWEFWCRLDWRVSRLTKGYGGTSECWKALGTEVRDGEDSTGSTTEKTPPFQNAAQFSSSSFLLFILLLPKDKLMSITVEREIELKWHLWAYALFGMFYMKICDLLLSNQIHTHHNINVWLPRDIIHRKSQRS